MKLFVKEDYVIPGISYSGGSTIDVDDLLGRWLLSDAPNTFEKVTEEKAEKQPPVDKMVRKAPRRKAI